MREPLDIHIASAAFLSRPDVYVCHPSYSIEELIVI